MSEYRSQFVVDVDTWRWTGIPLGPSSDHHGLKLMIVKDFPKVFFMRKERFAHYMKDKHYRECVHTTTVVVRKFVCNSE